MLKYYVNSEYRHAYDFLTAVGVIHPRSLNVSLIHSCLAEKSISQTNTFMTQCICVLRRAKLTPLFVLRSLLFLHIYLQKAKCIVETDLLSFLAYLLDISSQMEVRRKRSASVVKQKENIVPILNKSTVMSKVETSEDVPALIAPYVSFLQKSVSMFDLCYCLKTNVCSLLDETVAWTLLNMLRQITGITGNLKMDVIMRTFAFDLEWVYARLYRYVYGEIRRMESDRKLGIRSEGIASLWHLIQELQRENREISKMHFEGWRRPTYVVKDNECFRFINTIFQESTGIRREEKVCTKVEEQEQEEQVVEILGDILGDIVNWQAHRPIFQLCSTPKFGGHSM